jgi:hypothetical protein
MLIQIRLAKCGNDFFCLLLNVQLVWFMVFNTTFNNISAISWQSVLLVEETGVPEKTTDLSIKLTP